MMEDADREQPKKESTNEKWMSDCAIMMVSQSAHSTKDAKCERARVCVYVRIN